VDDDKGWHHVQPPVMFTIALVYFIPLFLNSNLYLSCHEQWFVINKPIRLIWI
jgi:hypothetical protein